MFLTEEPVIRLEPDPVEEETLEGLARQPRAWMIRAGVQGAFAESFIEAGIAAIDFGQLRDLSEVSGREQIAELRGRESPELSEAQVRDGAGQLWAFLSGIRLGDLVAMPRGGSSQFALGTVTQEYWYRHDSDSMRHAVSVDWKRTEVPRTALRSDLLKSLSRPRTVNRITTEDHVGRLHQLMETGMDPGPRLDLAEMVVQFRRETGYPTEDHERQKRLREEWAEKLAPGNVAHLSREDLAAYTRPSVDYGEYVNPTGSMLQWILDLDDDEYDRLRESIRDLCWGEDELSARIDRLVDWEGSRRDTGTKRFAQGNVNATLAICHPQRFLPVFFQGGKTGREQMLRTLNLPEPQGSTFGQQVVDANDRLREHLAPYLDDDPQAIAGFLYWLLDSDDVKEPVALSMDLTELAHQLLVDDEFLQDIISLLEDKGQVILYGPPGTGKTYLARALAEVLAPDDSCRALVQFHPSTSYEDFFEGYRPAGTGDDRSVRYELTPGPLARMAERASEAPDKQHVMIIDEINRGNLPRVLGELLFLLEYRKESVQTLYRPEEPFELPENLWFIGTMNTADRSIALVDAALRRRFHFVPFFPDSGPMAGLLRRWLRDRNQPAWVGDLVDAVNDELKRELGGSHLLLGPSHFMKEYGSSLDTQRERLRRIWEYNIEPFIEDQFFGDPNRIEHFRFKAVMGRHGLAAEPEVDANDDSNDPEGAESSEDEHAAVDGDAAAEASSAQPEGER